MTEADRDRPGAARGSALSENPTAPAFRRSGKAVVQRQQSHANPATSAPEPAPVRDAIPEDSYRLLGTAMLEILAEFVTALNQAKRTASGRELARIVAAICAVRDSKMASARATAETTARQRTAVREAAKTRPAQ